MQKLKSALILYPILYLIIFTNSTLAQENNNIKSLLLNGEYQKVINILELKLSKQDSLSLNEYNTLGVAHQNLMNFSKALHMFKKASELQPKNTRLLLVLGNTYVSLGNSKLAEEAYKSILTFEPENKTAKMSLGKTYIDLQKYGEGEKLFSELIQADSTNPYFYKQLAKCELKTGKRELAIKNYDKALSLNRFDINTIVILAKLYYRNKNYDEAYNIIQYGLIQNYKHKALSKLFAEVLYKKKQYESAILNYLFVISVGDTSAQTYQKLGLSYYYISFTNSVSRKEVKELKLNEAISALEKSYEKDNGNSLTALYLGLCNKALDKHKTAINYFEESLNKMFPDYIGEIYKNLAISNEQTKNYHDAIINYQKAIKYFPSNNVLTFYLASVYDRYYKDKSVALEYYKKFLNDNNNADIKLIEYSKSRLEQLNKDVNFWGK